jgi:hypothetical protein
MRGQMKIGNHDVFVWQEAPDRWRWRVDDRSGTAPCHTEALFWAGWWTGRRDLAKTCAELAGSVPTELNGGGPEEGKARG